MKLPRFIHKFYANLMGYFWLPCPLCGKNFGGHEINNDNYIFEDDMTDNMVCPNCHMASVEYNYIYLKKNPNHPIITTHINYEKLWWRQ